MKMYASIRTTTQTQNSLKMSCQFKIKTQTLITSLSFELVNSFLMSFECDY